jgi:hypothetical protein
MYIMLIYFWSIVIFTGRLGSAAAMCRGLVQELVRSAVYIFSMADFNHPYRKLVICYIFLF